MIWFIRCVSLLRNKKLTSTHISACCGVTIGNMVAAIYACLGWDSSLDGRKNNYRTHQLILVILPSGEIYRGAKANEMLLGLCSRTNDVVEPLIKPQ